MSVDFIDSSSGGISIATAIVFFSRGYFFVIASLNFPDNGYTFIFSKPSQSQTKIPTYFFT